jgi:hypothetical protein
METMKYRIVITAMLAAAALCSSCQSKKEAKAEARAKQTAKEWEQATGNLSEAYKLPEVKPAPLEWKRSDKKKEEQPEAEE